VPFQIESEHFGGQVKVIVPQVFPDQRGWFIEAYRRDSFTALGIPDEFVQHNQSCSVRGVIRGLHFQWDRPMAKLMRVITGHVFAVAVDIRKGSPTLGQWAGCELSAENKRQVYATPGFARGFCVLSDEAELHYLCSAVYNPATEVSVRWDDPDIGIDWPVSAPILSDKDAQALSLAAWLASDAARHLAYEAEKSP
jgi:dTDP-4-dehydrorhamnose 3,5-epimerase